MDETGKNYLPKKALRIETGMTTVAHIMSLMANDTRKKLNILRNLRSNLTARHTRVLPPIAMNMIRNKNSAGQLYDLVSPGILSSLLFACAAKLPLQLTEYNPVSSVWLLIQFEKLAVILQVSSTEPDIVVSFNSFNLY